MKTEYLDRIRMLERMFTYTKLNFRDKLLKLNRAFDLEFPIGCKRYSEYDNFRQSCIMSQIYPTLREQYVSDARIRLNVLVKLERN
ncbi:Uncharacterised protein [uncultured archaeon]|nr:Uncharacterised protein [uncultured archaeon]